MTTRSKHRSRLLLSLCLLLGCAAPARAQYPDILYYKCDGPAAASMPNLASPNIQAPTATLFGGHSLGGVGQFNGGITAGGAAGGTDYLDTGWIPNLGGSSWTLSMWLDLTPTAPSTTIGYFFGEIGAGSWRAFINGAAGTNNAILRGPHPDVILPGAADRLSGHVLTWVHDSAATLLKGYIDGALVATVTAPAFSINGTANLKVFAYTTSTGMPAGTVMDEFRLFGSALTDAQVQALALVELFDRNVLSLSQSGPGVGDLTVTMGNVSPTAGRCFGFLSGVTSQPVGSGPVLGIVPDALFFETFRFGYTPGLFFHCDARDQSVYPNAPLVLPAGSLSTSAGITIDAVALFFTPAGFYDSRSNVVRITLQ